MNEFITVEAARERILSGLIKLADERVFLGEAAGRVLSEAILAPWDQPRFAHSARDGYALRFEDLERGQANFKLVGVSAAGAAPDFEVLGGQAARITTGAPLPAGADLVVMQEDCAVDEAAKEVRVQDPAVHSAGQWVRQIGEDMAKGEVLLGVGSALGAAEVGLLAGLGRAMVSVAQRPRVSVVSTGDELVDPGTPSGPAQIVNSNAYMLAALVEEFGGVATVLPIAPDDKGAIRQAFERACASSDLVLSSGGVSVGDFDLTRGVLDELTGGMDFWKIRMKPGKPLAFGVADGSGAALVGLPGNPNACFVGFHQFVRPALALLQGRALDDLIGRPPLAVPARARLGAEVKTTPRRRVYLGGTLHPADDPSAPAIFMPLENQQSGNLRLFCQSNAFGVVEEGVSELRAGDEILVEKI